MEKVAVGKLVSEVDFDHVDVTLVDADRVLESVTLAVRGVVCDVDAETEKDCLARVDDAFWVAVTVAPIVFERLTEAELPSWLLEYDAEVVPVRASVADSALTVREAETSSVPVDDEVTLDVRESITVTVGPDREKVPREPDIEREDEPDASSVTD